MSCFKISRYCHFNLLHPRPKNFSRKTQAWCILHQEIPRQLPRRSPTHMISPCDLASLQCLEQISPAAHLKITEIRWAGAWGNGKPESLAALDFWMSYWCLPIIPSFDFRFSTYIYTIIDLETKYQTTAPSSSSAAHLQHGFWQFRWSYSRVCEPGEISTRQTWQWRTCFMTFYHEGSLRLRTLRASWLPPARWHWWYSEVQPWYPRKPCCFSNNTAKLGLRAHTRGCWEYGCLGILGFTGSMRVLSGLVHRYFLPTKWSLALSFSLQSAGKQNHTSVLSANDFPPLSMPCFSPAFNVSQLSWPCHKNLEEPALTFWYHRDIIKYVCWYITSYNIISCSRV